MEPREKLVSQFEKCVRAARAPGQLLIASPSLSPLLGVLPLLYRANGSQKVA